MTLPGDVIGPYRLLYPIGSGGMGQVFAAVHQRMDQEVALKLLAPAAAAEPQLVARFLQEARALSRLEHPGIVRVLNCDRLDDGRVYLAMERLDGVSLREWLKTSGPPALDAALALAHQIAEVMVEVHAAGIVHRDLKPENVSLCPDEAVAPGQRVNFLNEALALQHVRHPHIVRVLDYGALPEGPPFMILEWLPVDLHGALLRAGGGFSPEVAAHVAMQLADALAALHAHGLVHRDLKPANVLLSREDPALAEIKLADLGLAKLLSIEAAGPQAHGSAGPLAALPLSTGGSALLGTWEYMAPEQWVQSKSVDSRVDVYALGVLLFQMLAGRLPFVADQQKDWMYFHVMEAPPLELLDSRAPAGVRDLVARMMSKKPSRRPTMQKVVASLAEQRSAGMG